MSGPTIQQEIIEKWRSEFELIIQKHHTHLTLVKSPLDRYSHMGVEALWQGFLIGRSTAELTLPPKISVGFGTNRSFSYVEIEPLIESINAQGYSVKGDL